MSIYIDENTRVLVQGITGQEGEFHARQCIYYGTRVVAGVSPGKGGELVREVPVFDTVGAAVAATGATCSLLMVPPAQAGDAIMEAIDAGIALIVAVTAGIPLLETMKIKHYLTGKSSRLIGPDSFGIITPGRCKTGVMPGPIFKPGGPLGVVSRSGTLTYEVVQQLTLMGLGQTTCVGLGRDPVVGTGITGCLAAFEADPATRGMVIVAEGGGSELEEVAEYVRNQVSKPVLAFVAGLSPGGGRRLGDASAIVNGRGATGAAQAALWAEAGITLCEDLATLSSLSQKVFSALGN